jgi:hypothetical protein
VRDGPVWRSGDGGLRSRGYSVFAFLGFLSPTLLITKSKFGNFFLDKHADGKFEIYLFIYFFSE